VLRRFAPRDPLHLRVIDKQPRRPVPRIWSAPLWIRGEHDTEPQKPSVVCAIRLRRYASWGNGRATREHWLRAVSSGPKRRTAPHSKRWLRCFVLLSSKIVSVWGDFAYHGGMEYHEISLNDSVINPVWFRLGCFGLFLATPGFQVADRKSPRLPLHRNSFHPNFGCGSASSCPSLTSWFKNP